jgi:hypothetical protein
MKRLAIVAGVLALAGLAAGNAFGQAIYDTPLGDIYLSFSNTAPPFIGPVNRYLTVAPFAGFHFYLMLYINFGDAPYNDPSRNAGEGAQGWETAVVPFAGLIVQSRAIAPAGSLDVGSGDDNWIVGTGGQCITAASTPFALVDYNGLLLSAVVDQRVDLAAASPSSFDDPPRTSTDGQPGWLLCPGNGHLVPTFPGWPTDWIMVNPTPPAVDETSWGTLKSTFSGR